MIIHIRQKQYQVLQRGSKKEENHMGKWDLNLKCTYKNMPRNVRIFLKELLGKEEFRKLMHHIRCHHFIMLVGPECSGKSTVAHILRRLGYPFVVDDDGLGMVIHTSQPISVRHSELKSYRSIFEELGI